MSGAGLRGAPASDGSHRAGGRDGSPPAASLRRQRLTRRPGYMRSTAGPRIGFLSPAVGTPFGDPGGASREESSAGRCGLDRSNQGPGPSVGRPVPQISAAPVGTTVGPLSLAQTSVTGTPMCFGIHLRAGTRLPDRPTWPCGPESGGCQPEFLPMDGSEARGPSRDAPCSEGARGVRAPAEVSGNSCSLGHGPAASTAPRSSHNAFTSSFSFIQLSLDSAGVRGEAEGCPPCGEPESPHQSPWETGAEAASSDKRPEDPQRLSAPSSLTATPGLASGSSSRPERGVVSSLEVDTGCSSAAPSLAGCCGVQGSGSGDAHDWDALLGLWEPALRDCLQSNRRQLQVTSLRLKLQKLKEKALADEDYDAAEALRQRLEDVEQEEGGLHWALPSKSLALHSFLGHLAAQAQAALHRATQRAASDDTHALLQGDQRPPEPTAQDSLRVSTARRDWLLLQKQQLQEEIEALQARMSVLEAKDQQLGRELEEQERRLRWQGCGLTARMAQLSPGQLQEVSRALQDTLASASQIPSHGEPPESIRSLRERIKSLNLSLKEIATKVGTSERLSSTLRRRVSDLETQLPALLEAKTLAIAGDHFCTAKDLVEEIRSVTSEREGLEAVLGKLLTLSSRHRTRLARVQEDHDRLRGELARWETAHKASVQEKTVKYMEVLKETLCRCPLLGRVWEADLEACRLLLQNVRLQEAGASLTAEDEQQVDELSAAACTATQAASPKPCPEDQSKPPTQACHGRRAPHAPSPRCAAGEQQEEPPIFPAELGEKCEAIGKKLLLLEDELDTAMRGCDEDLIQSLKGELQMVKETLQAMILQLQPAKEAGGGEAAASCTAAGPREAHA